ncbi:MAG TPA: hypothetical protein VK464_12950 [Symbiobacteriaceae bacterium]|jgi:hypothetical protein|nr:hypothetical protein [Symbiobacteriaceae bacterium]
MSGPKVAFAVHSASNDREHVTIQMNGRPAGEAVIRYDEATARVDAHLRLEQHAVSQGALPDFHTEFAAELLAFVANRGAMAQEAEGQVTYSLGAQAVAIDLPSNPEAGLGYPNSW